MGPVLMMHAAQRLTIAWLALMMLVSSSCTSSKIEKNLSAGYYAQTQQINALMAQLDDGSVSKPIRWKDALKRMRQDNLAVEQSNKLLEEAAKNRSRAWRQLVPRVSGYMSLSTQLDSLLDFSSDDINQSLIANFNIPNPFTFHATLYGAGLSYERAKHSHELDKRKAYVELYKAFIAARDFREQVAELQEQMENPSGNVSSDSAEELHQLQQQWTSLKRQRKTHRVNINRLFNTPGDNWELVGKLPDISYRKKYRNIEIGDDFGKRAMYLYAIRTESAILAKKRVKFRQWPILNFGLSQPPLYSSSRTTTYELENFNLFSGASKSLDLTDPLGLDEIRNAEFRFAYTRKTMLQNMEREALRLSQMKDAYQSLLLKERRLKQLSDILEKDVASDVEVVLAQLEAIKENRKQLTDVRRQLVRQDLQYLIWDETFWK